MGGGCWSCWEWVCLLNRLAGWLACHNLLSCFAGVIHEPGMCPGTERGVNKRRMTWSSKTRSVCIRHSSSARGARSGQALLVQVSFLCWVGESENALATCSPDEEAIWAALVFAKALPHDVGAALWSGLVCEALTRRRGCPSAMGKMPWYLRAGKIGVCVWGGEAVKS